MPSAEVLLPHVRHGTLKEGFVDGEGALFVVSRIVLGPRDGLDGLDDVARKLEGSVRDGPARKGADGPRGFAVLGDDANIPIYQLSSLKPRAIGT